MKAVISTNKGDMHVEFFEKDAPNTEANFVKLAKEGYYNGLKWHRVIPNFVIQGGCPWHMPAEIQVVHNFLFVIQERKLHT